MGKGKKHKVKMPSLGELLFTIAELLADIDPDQVSYWENLPITEGLSKTDLGNVYGFFYQAAKCATVTITWNENARVMLQEMLDSGHVPGKLG